MHIAQEHGDGPILEHVNELIDSLEAKGIKSIWEYVDTDSEDGNGGVKMLSPCLGALSWGTDTGRFKLGDLMDSPDLKQHTSANLYTGPEHCDWRLEI